MRVLAIIFLGINLAMATHEFDLAGPAEFQKSVSDLKGVFGPDRIELSPSSNSSQFEYSVFIKKGKKLSPVSALTNRVVTHSQCSKGTMEVSMANRYFNIKDRRTYSLLINTPCGKKAKLIFDHDSPAGQVIGIYSILTLAVQKFSDLSLINFWKRKIKFKFPSSGDYYSWGTVHITKGHQWDVVAHELGHAIYDQADIGAFGGGPHRIDECYSKALALSEGWASFFGAWLKVSLNDPDAKFEYLVPRRAPIKFENIPTDVCTGSSNEWRVTGYLWDIIDSNRDGEVSEEAFKRLWLATLKKGFSSLDKLHASLKMRGFDAKNLDQIWKISISGL